MSISGIGSKSSLQIQSLIAMRAQLDDLQRQLGTGKKANTYAGLGLDRGLTVGLRAQLTAIGSFGNTIASVGTRLSVAQETLTQIDKSIHTVRNTAVNSPYEIDQTGKTVDQKTAFGQLDQILGMLNTQVGNRYIYSGQSPDVPAVDTLDHILNGAGSRAGFTQILAERSQADLGATGLGRLVIPAATATGPATITGTGATLTADAQASGTGTVGGLTGATTLASLGLTPADSITVGDGTNTDTFNVPVGGTVQDLLDAINLTGTAAVSASLVAGQLVVLSNNAVDTVTVGGSGAAAVGFGAGNDTFAPTNLLTQGAVTAGQTLTVQVGANTQLSVVFGTGVGQVATLAQLNAQLGTLAGGTASVNLTNGNITVTAGNNVDPITVGGTATAANFGIQTLTAGPPGALSISEDAAGHPFGFKLASVLSGLTGTVATGPAGAPATINIAVATNPNAGETIKFTFNLPDGTTADLTMTATASATPGPNEFTIGATPAATAANLQAALTTSVGNFAASTLSAASAIAASNDFFNVDAANPPRRIGGTSPFYAATTLVAGTSTNTVMWYTGEAGTTPARDTAIARIDTSLTVSYGMRANEQAIRSAVANIAAFSAMSFSPGDPNAAARYEALKARVSPNLGGPQGQQRMPDIEAEIGAAQSAMKSATDRQQQTKSTLTDLLQSVEGISQEEVGAKLLAMQTNLEASLQTTALLSKLSLVNYL